MKKVFAILLAFAMVFALAACSGGGEPEPEPEVDIFAKSEGVMTYAEYAAAAAGTEVTVEAFVQAAQSWWNNTVTVYAQDNEGGYYLYEMTCSEEDAEKLVPGTKIKAVGQKSEENGEVQIVNATFEIEEDATYIAPPLDVTAVLDTEDMIKYQNMFVLYGQPAAASQGNETGRIHALALGVVALQPGVPSRGTRPLSRDTIAGVSAARWTSGYGSELFFTHYLTTDETTRCEPRSNVPRRHMQHAVPTHATRCMSHENRVFPGKGHEAPKNAKFWSDEYQMISITPVHPSCQNGAKKGHFCHILGWSARSVNSGKSTIYLQFRNTSTSHGQKHQRRPHGRL